MQAAKAASTGNQMRLEAVWHINSISLLDLSRLCRTLNMLQECSCQTAHPPELVTGRSRQNRTGLDNSISSAVRDGLAPPVAAVLAHRS